MSAPPPLCAVRTVHGDVCGAQGKCTALEFWARFISTWAAYSVQACLALGGDLTKWRVSTSWGCAVWRAGATPWA